MKKVQVYDAAEMTPGMFPTEPDVVLAEQETVGVPLRDLPDKFERPLWVTSLIGFAKVFWITYIVYAIVHWITG